MAAFGQPQDRRLTEHPGDIGRRVRSRRERLGLSRTETAARAGMAVSFLEYLESSPAAPEAGTLTGLAAALGTSVAHLLGGGLGPPPGHGAPAGRPVPVPMAPSECWGRLSPGGVGRVALATPEGPVVLPVNFRVVDGTVLYRTAADGILAAVAGSRVAFEVDRLDDELSEGWSVLVTGIGQPVTAPEALAWLGRHADPRPWAGGRRDTWIRIRPRGISGRVIRAADTP